MDRFAALYCTVPPPRPQEHGRGQPRPARGVVAPVVSEDHAAGGEVRALRGQVGQQTLGHLQHTQEGVLLNTYWCGVVASNEGSRIFHDHREGFHIEDTFKTLC